MPSQTEREAALWKLLVQQGLCYDGGGNTTLPFAGMSKRYGKAYIVYLQAAYQAKGELTDNEFCEINGNVPASLIDKLINI